MKLRVKMQAVLLAMMLTLSLLPVTARAEYTVDETGCAEVIRYQDLLDAAADESVAEIAVTGTLTIPRNEAVRIEKPLHIREKCTVKLQTGATLTNVSGVANGTEIYEGEDAWLRMLDSGAEAYVVLDGQKTLTRTIYSSQSDAEAAFREYTAQGLRTTRIREAVFAARDLTVASYVRVEGTLAVLNGHNITVTGGGLSAGQLLLTDIRPEEDEDYVGGGSVLVKQGGHLDVQVGIVEGDVILPDNLTILPKALIVNGSVRVGGTETLHITNSTGPFTDVTGGPYYDAVVWAYQANVATGDLDGSFQPAKTCTRGQALTFFWRASGRPTPRTADAPFTDITPDSPYYTAVLWAWEQGIAAGLTEDTFGADRYCTRGQMVTYLWRAAGRPAGPTILEDYTFRDVPPESIFYDAISWAAWNGYVAGITDTTFSPNLACNRGEVIQFCYRYFGRVPL